MNTTKPLLAQVMVLASFKTVLDKTAGARPGTSGLFNFWHGKNSGCPAKTMKNTLLVCSPDAEACYLAIMPDSSRDNSMMSYVYFYFRLY